MKSILKKIRMLILLTFKYKFKSVGKGFYCGKGIIVRPGTVTIGNQVYIGNRCHLAVNKLIIDDYVMLASNVSVVGGDHRFDVVGTPTRNTGRDVQKDVYIGKDAWLGHQSVVMHGITIGEGSIVAAGSIVTKDVEPYTIVAGNPAVKLRNRFNTIEEAYEHSRKINGNYFDNKE